MDRNALIGMLLISLIIGVWMFYSSLQHQSSAPPSAPGDTLQSNAPAAASMPSVTPAQPVTPEKKVRVVTDHYTATISSLGMTIKRWELHHYKAWYGAPVQLVQPGAREVGITFTLRNGEKVAPRQQPFTFLNAPADGTIRIGKDSAFTLRGIFQIGGATVERAITFYGSTYHIALRTTFDNADTLFPLTRRWYDVGWTSGLKYQEASSVEESSHSTVFASLNGSLDEVDVTEYNKPVSVHQSGTVEYIGTKTKYFMVALLNGRPDRQAEYFLEGVMYGAPNNGRVKVYSAVYRVPYRGGRQSDSLAVYIGPLDYDIVKPYGLQATVNFGWRWIVRPIGEFFMLPIFKAIHSIIPNYGFSIIVFSILMKLLLYPLSRGQMQSALKMRALQPEIEKLRKKYADDPMELQRAQMQLFSEYGVNPMGGCLPLLLQLPILYALYAVLATNIAMRQASFIPGWIDDLSIPDHVLRLPFSIFGIEAISGMALIMGLTLFIQQKMTITDPNQKALVYIMPIMLTLMFSYLPSGLNLYYLVFNLLGIIQQVWMTKFSKKQLTLADLKRMPKKEGWLQKRLRIAQELAAAQGRSFPVELPGEKKQQHRRPAKKKR
ncbi:MAG: membrane protein insertase YidC [Bacteroidota bacterium]|nr:membrane protein insertase YidC [Candidatus Kapabacteria bacterium]MDW8075774.1 membrane protein insertase YidC [Bacteroidota bacterium]MDW8272453.1 membrane protein insertase YidC [Bacteroidota bacterium]